MIKNSFLIIFVLVTSAISVAKTGGGDPCQHLATEYKSQGIEAPIEFIARCQKVHNGNVNSEADTTLTGGSVCLAKFTNSRPSNERATACQLSGAPIGADFYLFAGNGQILNGKSEKYTRQLPSVLKADMISLNKLNYLKYYLMKGDEAKEGSYFNWCVNTLRDDNFDCEKALLGSLFSVSEMPSGACGLTDRIITKEDGAGQYEVLYDYDKKSHQLYLKETVDGRFPFTRTQISAILDCEEIK